VSLYERGGSSVEEGFDGLHVVAYCVAVLLVVMKWTAAITGDQSGYFGSFSRRKRIFATVFHKAEIEDIMICFDAAFFSHFDW
jgi:hypothetical protein